MIETTVTMSLDRFKELESAERALLQMIGDPQKYILAKPMFSGTEYAIPLSDEVNAHLLKVIKDTEESRDNTIKKVRDYEKRTGRKVFEL